MGHVRRVLTTEYLYDDVSCPRCHSTNLSSGPLWRAISYGDDSEEILEEIICRDCDKSFWT